MSQKLLETISMWLMIAGILFLCQPWVEFLHDYSVLIMLIGLIGFNIAAHMPTAKKVQEEINDPVSASETVKTGAGHG